MFFIISYYFINLLNDSSNEESKFATKKWYFIDSQATKGKYKQSDAIKFKTETIKSSLCDYSDAFILVTGNITVDSIIQMLLLKTVYHFLHVQQKLMIYLLTKKIIFTLRCLCTI